MRDEIRTKDATIFGNLAAPAIPPFVEAVKQGKRTSPIGRFVHAV